MDLPATPRFRRNLKETKLIVARWVILSLLFAGRLAAQSEDFNRVDTDALPNTPTPATSGPARAKPERVFDKKFFVVIGALGAGESLRFTSRKLVLERERAAGAPWVTSIPSNQHIVAKDLALYGSEFFVAYELKKAHSWLPGDRHPQTVVGVPGRDDRHSYQECGGQYSHPGAWGLHVD